MRELDREVVEDCRDVDLELDQGSEMSSRRDMEVSFSFSLSFSLELSLSVANKEGEFRRERVVGNTADADFSEEPSEVKIFPAKVSRTHYGGF